MQESSPDRQAQKFRFVLSISIKPREFDMMIFGLKHLSSMMIAAVIGLLILTLPIQAQSTVALVQLPSEQVGNFDAMLGYARQAKEQGAELIVFPEGSVFGWLNPAVFTKAAPIPGVYSDKFAAIAKTANIWVAAGLAEKGPKAGEGSQQDAYEAYDSGILINPQGEWVLHHRKYNLRQSGAVGLFRCVYSRARYCSSEAEGTQA